VVAEVVAELVAVLVAEVVAGAAAISICSNLDLSFIFSLRLCLLTACLITLMKLLLCSIMISSDYISLLRVYLCSNTCDLIVDIHIPGYHKVVGARGNQDCLLRLSPAFVLSKL